MTFHVETELAAQPENWLQAAGLAAEHRTALPRRGERVAVVGCGTSWFMAMAYAGLREAAGEGETDAFAGSEFPADRAYDRVVAISRSGTTSEVLALLEATSGIPTVVITAVPDSPVVSAATFTIPLPFADETSVVQTRFATTVLALLRAHLGEDVSAIAADGQRALRVDIADDVAAEQITFLGRGWTIGLANEAALKCREASQSWVESYPAMDYRHGPIAIAEPGRAVWMLGDAPDGLAADVAATGALFRDFGTMDPLAVLVIAQRVAVAKAIAKGLDPDAPRHLTRSVILDGLVA